MTGNGFFQRTTVERTRMRWWHIFSPPLVETVEGLYRPVPQRLALCAYIFAAAAITGIYWWSVTRGKPSYLALGYAALMAMRGLYFWVAHRKFGALGRPLVRVDESSISVSFTTFLSQRLKVVRLSDVKAVVVHGKARSRLVAFYPHEGYPIQVLLQQGRLEERIVDFLQRKLPASIPIQIEEPLQLSGVLRAD
ncbi:hypothetical protein [Acidovorax sp. 62]|uniref:hypothetical protein n=1 Tax=Acidovorax sp. 62 TaxID=2035203 RepID=UPI001178B43C|nr:hypothetical protein [Acidovorax sp. 62]